jgi:hypothetical protein
MANTENIEAKLAAYLDGELDAVDRAEIEQYLAANPQHRQLIDELARDRDWLRGLPREAAPPEVAETLSAHLERAALLGDVDIGVSGGSMRIGRWPQVRAIAAVMLVTVGLAAVVYSILPAPKTPAPTVAIITPDTAADDSMRRIGPSPATAEAMMREAVVETPERESLGREVALGAGGAATPSATAPADVVISDRAPETFAARARADDQPARMGAVDEIAADPIASTALAYASERVGGDALYLFVRTNDSTVANTQLVNYLSANGIDYQPLASDASGEAARELELSRRAPTTEPAGMPTTQPASAPATVSGGTTFARADTETVRPSRADLYVARRMTRRQAAELNDTLQQAVAKQVAQVFEPQEAQTIARLGVQRRGQQQTDALQQQQMQQPDQIQAGQMAANKPVTDPQSGFRDKDGSYRTQGEILQPGDSVHISSTDAAPSDRQRVDETHAVDADGNVTVGRVGKIRAAGSTPDELAKAIAQALPEDERAKGEPAWSVEKLPPSPGAAGLLPAQQHPLDDKLQAGALNVASTAPSTQPTATDVPAPATGPAVVDAEQKVDVVIVIYPEQSGATRAPVTDTPPEPATVPATLPATAPTTTGT